MRVTGNYTVNGGLTAPTGYTAQTGDTLTFWKWGAGTTTFANGGNLAVEGGSVAISNGDTVTFIYYSGNWAQIGYSNN